MASAAAIKATTLGKQAKSDLPKAVFGEDFHESLVHEAARADMNSQRRGTASSLGRGEVSMTTAKAWRQKGTGRARVGALSSPTRRGGGAAFGPKPRHYTFKVNRKARRRALRSALSVHAARNSVAVIDGASFSEPATKTAAEQLAKWGAKSPTLVILDVEETAAAKSFRNLPKVTVLPATAAGVADVIGHASLVVSQEALKTLEERSAEVTRGNGAAVTEEAEPEAKPKPAAKKPAAKKPKAAAEPEATEEPAAATEEPEADEADQAEDAAEAEPGTPGSEAKDAATEGDES
jgi:large subunit ribosomal protein L4